ncbi:MAG: hypothetical protein IJQ89_03700 [Bacteroidales bacterium]|nr:hypothetical protein [Bacteroidales bacterium]
MINLFPSVQNILNWVREKKQGRGRSYDACIADTDSAISMFQNDFRNRRFKDGDEIMRWFIRNLKTKPPQKRPENYKSYYRPFLTKAGEKVLVFRITDHYSTKEGMNKLYSDKTPEKAIHIIVDRLLNDSTKDLIDKDLDANDPQSGVNFSHDVYELSAEQIKDPVMIGRLADALVSELTDGTKVNINESETDRLVPTRHVLTFEEYGEFLAILEDGQRA